MSSISIFLGYRKMPDCGHYEGCFRVVDPSEDLDAEFLAYGHFLTSDAALEAAKNHARNYCILLAAMGVLSPEDVDVPYQYMSPN